jgi:mono/diheme cytochrome c family protein
MAARKVRNPEMSKTLNRMLSRFFLIAGCACLALGSTSSLAADADHGKTIAKRWCAGCHLVEPAQKSATTDQAPPFASLARTPDFGAGKLALLLLKPHPNMPKLALSRAEVADLAEYILTLR